MPTPTSASPPTSATCWDISHAEDGDDLYFLESTGEFVVVSPAGYIRTYYLTDRDYFDRQ